MKVINSGDNKFQIFGSDLKTYEELPAGTYRVAFSPMSGFSLIKQDNFETMETKIYGMHGEKIDKVVRSYQRAERSLGVMLSGDKGMGKSLFTQQLSQAMIETGIPVVIVDAAIPGIAGFLETIKQECMFLFDEFEKVFSNRDERPGGGGPQGNMETQTSMLSLFDGMSQQKRLYAITVNKLHMVSDYILSRTGRFHYHITFNYPTADEVEVYMQDKLLPAYHDQIKHVLAFSSRVKLNYDSLRAIAFEINGGYTFMQAIGDLNIMTTEAQQYNVAIHFSNGQVSELKAQRLDLFDEDIRLDSVIDTDEYYSVRFGTGNIATTPGGALVVPKGDITVSYDGGNEQYTKESGITVTAVTLTHFKPYNVTYKEIAM